MMEIYPMKKTMKTSDIKQIVVKLSADIMFLFDIDPNIFDDPHLEAATRAIERCKIQKYNIIRPIIETWDKKYQKTPKKHQLYNSYWVLVNAALYSKAELLRQKFMMQSDVDLAKEPICGTK